MGMGEITRLLLYLRFLIAVVRRLPVLYVTDGAGISLEDSGVGCPVGCRVEAWKDLDLSLGGKTTVLHYLEWEKSWPPSRLNTVPHSSSAVCVSAVVSGSIQQILGGTAAMPMNFKL